MDDSRLEALIDSLLDSHATPEDVCADCPDLLPVVRRRWHDLNRVRADLDMLFPPSSDADDSSPELLWKDTAIPRLPGYEIEGVLGRGGVGVVYRARHLRLNRCVALKMLLAGPYTLPDEAARFVREAETVARLRHPNIVQLYDVGDVEGRPYFTMEPVEGGSLARKLAGAPLPAREAAALVAAVAEAVQAAHESGIIHRDLKPANILLTREGTPKVSDFGLARQLENEIGLTLSGAPLGTPSYMAPEQARGDKKRIGPATDIYALGAILYECLTGRPPFRGETSAATLHQVLTDEPVPPKRLNPRVPRDLITICLKCLQKDPQRRYVSAAALADDLRRFGRSEPIAARPAGLPERGAKWARRRPAAAVLLAAAVLMFAGVTAATLWYVDHRARLRSEEDARGAQVNREANAALAGAEDHLNNLRARLDDPLKVRELLSDIDQWRVAVGLARLDLERAESASAGNEALLTERTRDRRQEVKAAVDREEAAYGLAKELDNIAVEAFASFNTGRTQQRRAAAEYERLFSQQGLDIRQPRTVWFASAIRSSPVRFAFLAALDMWALLADYYTQDLQQVARLLELARAADPDPWRDRFRDPAVWSDRDTLAELAREVDVGRQSPMVLASLAWLLTANDADPTALYDRALLEYPRDFLLRFHAALRTKDPGLKAGLAQAALAVRPRSAAAYQTLAFALLEMGDWSAALLAANRTIEINPNYNAGYIYRGRALRAKNDLSGALAAFKKAAEIDPDYGLPWWQIADVFLLQGDEVAAADAYRQAVERDCTAAVSRKRLGGPQYFKNPPLRKLKDQPAVIAAFRRAIELDAGDFLGSYILGQVFQQQGRYTEAEQAYLGAIQVQPAWVPVCDSLALLLATCPDDKVRDGKRAVGFATTACERTSWEDPFCLDTLASAYAEAGQFEEAVRYQSRALETPAIKGDLRSAAKKRLELYRQKKPFRDQGP